LAQEAQEMWSQLAPELSRLGLLTLVDLGSLAAYCQAWAEFQEATKTLQQEGRHFATDTGYLAPHPAVSQQRSAWAAIKAFSSLLGLDPSSRLRVKGKPEDTEDEDPFEAFVRGKGKPRA
jgi:P27 family predicted phage terminase small subunit